MLCLLQNNYKWLKKITRKHEGNEIKKKKRKKNHEVKRKKPPEKQISSILKPFEGFDPETTEKSAFYENLEHSEQPRMSKKKKEKKRE